MDIVFKAMCKHTRSPSAGPKETIQHQKTIQHSARPPSPAAPIAAIAITWLLVAPIVCYIVWILFGVVAWVQHLGDDATALGYRFAHYLPGSGAQDQLAAVDSIFPFLQHNVPLGLLFVAQHSVLSIRALERFNVPPRWARLLYSACSAAALHFFLVNFAPLTSLTLFQLPVPRQLRFGGGLCCLMVASCCTLLQPRTWALLGVSQALKWNSTLGTTRFQLPGGSMDAITWMGRCTFSVCGSGGFVLFSGLSIIPYNTNVGDVVVRVVAAYYLRKRSSSFREWIRQIEQAHLLTWILRASLFLTAMWSWDGLSGAAVQFLTQPGQSSVVSSLCDLASVLAIGLIVALALRHAEK